MNFKRDPIILFLKTTDERLYSSFNGIFNKSVLTSNSGGKITKKIMFLTPGIIEKKVSPRHQSRYIGSTLNVVYRKLKVFEAPITFAIGS
jgi:hypothetical protein